MKIEKRINKIAVSAVYFWFITVIVVGIGFLVFGEDIKTQAKETDTKPGEQRQTDFFKIVAWGSDALFVSRYFSKGSMIAVMGSLQSNNFTDNKGNKRTSVEVKATELSFCGSKSEGKTGNQAPYDDYEEIG